jgi:hypothetical protein
MIRKGLKLFLTLKHASASFFWKREKVKAQLWSMNGWMKSLA